MAEEINGAGFTVKEMLVRVETKVDMVLADHEQRLRRIENNDAVIAGETTKSDKISAKMVAWTAIGITTLAALSQIVYYYLFFNHIHP